MKHYLLSRSSYYIHAKDVQRNFRNLNLEEKSHNIWDKEGIYLDIVISCICLFCCVEIEDYKYRDQKQSLVYRDADSRSAMSSDTSSISGGNMP